MAQIKSSLNEDENSDFSYFISIFGRPVLNPRDKQVFPHNLHQCK